MSVPDDPVVNVDENPIYVIISRHLKSVIYYDNQCQGYVDSEEALNNFLEDFRVASGVSFITRNSLLSRYA